jgi:DNA-binding transcriptional LysR family regulator
VEVRGRVDADEYAFIRAMLLAGAGVALGPLPMFTPLVRSGDLERVLPRYAHRGPAVHIVWPSRRFEPAAVTLLREAIAAELLRTLGAAGRPPR